MAVLGIVGNAGASSQLGPRRARPRLKVTVADLENWRAIAAPRDALEYHRGFLAMERGVGSGPPDDDRRRELGRVAEAVMILANAGQVFLVQRRHGPDDYTYMAIASRSITRSPACRLMSEAAS
jgi:hypothetical protein